MFIKCTFKTIIKEEEAIQKLILFMEYMLIVLSMLDLLKTVLSILVMKSKKRKILVNMS